MISNSWKGIKAYVLCMIDTIYADDPENPLSRMIKIVDNELFEDIIKVGRVMDIKLGMINHGIHFDRDQRKELKELYLGMIKDIENNELHTCYKGHDSKNRIKDYP